MAFQYRRVIDVTKNSVSDLTGHQVLVQLTSSNFDFSRTLAGGADIRFYADSGQQTALDYEIESWDDTAETADIWVEPNADDNELHLFYGDAALSDGQSGANTFPDFFDHFTNTETGVIAFGTDAGFMSAYCPLNRRLYTFGQDFSSGNGTSCVQWYNIDDGSVGFVYPGLDTPVNAAGVVWNATEAKFFIYGGRLMTSSTRQTLIQTFDPVAETFATLSEVLPEALSESGVFEYPSTGDNYVLGGWNAVTQSDNIYVHDPVAGTVTDTTAVLPTPRSNMGVCWSTAVSKAYVIGGWGGGTTNYGTIHTYDPASPATNPVDTGTTHSPTVENPAVCEYNGTIIIAGGLNRGAPNVYDDTIHELDTSDNSLVTLSETLDRADDDITAIYDSTNDRVYIWPVLHSSQATDNQSYEKVVVAQYNPNTQTLATEPSLGSLPTGWTNVSSSATRTPQAVGGSYMVVADDETDKYVAAEKSVNSGPLSGVYMVEARVAINQTGTNFSYQMRVGGSFAGADEIAIIRTANSANWNLLDTADTTIAAVPTGDYHIIGMGVDTASKATYGLLNRGSKTAAQGYRDAGGSFGQVAVNTSTAERMAMLVDWVKVRKWTTGTEPTTAVSGEMNVRAAMPARLMPLLMPRLGGELTFAGVAPRPDDFPFLVIAGQGFTPGAVKGGIFSSGAADAQVFTPGAVQGEVSS